MLSFLPILINFFNSTLGKVMYYILFFLVTISLGYIFFHIHDSNTRENALLEYSRNQLEFSLANQKKIQLQLDTIKEYNEKIIIDLKKKNEELQNKIDSANEYLDSEEVQKSTDNNKSSSKILQETIRRLSK